MMKLKNYQKRDMLNPKMTVEEFQNIKGFLTYGIMKKIADKTELSKSAVSNTFRGITYNTTVAYVTKGYVEKYMELYAEGAYEPR